MVKRRATPGTHTRGSAGRDLLVVFPLIADCDAAVSAASPTGRAPRPEEIPGSPGLPGAPGIPQVLGIPG